MTVNTNKLLKMLHISVTGLPFVVPFTEYALQFHVTYIYTIFTILTHLQKYYNYLQFDANI